MYKAEIARITISVMKMAGISNASIIPLPGVYWIHIRPLVRDQWTSSVQISKVEPPLKGLLQFPFERHKRSGVSLGHF